MISWSKSFIFTLLSVIILGSAVTSAQICPPQGPDIIVTGGYYPIQWNRPYPDAWRYVDPLIPRLPSYDAMQAWNSDPGSFIQVSTLENPAAKIKIGPNVLAHINARHLYNSPGDGSKFSQKYSEPIHLLSLIAYTVTHAVPVSPQATPRVLYYTSTIPDYVGSSYGVPTDRVTVSAYNTGKYEAGMPIYIVTNMYPGER